MNLSWKTALAGAVSALALAAAPAQAANYVLNLSGSAFDTTTNSFTFNGRDYDTGALELTGFDPFILEDGDTVEVTVNITSGPLFPFIVPLRQEMFFGLNFADISGGAEPTSAMSDGFFSFDGAPEVQAGCSNCTSFIYGQSGQPLYFTTLTARGTINLAEPYQVNSITVSYQVSDRTAGVPEPGAWALMILGFGGAGAMLRRRRGQDGGKLALA
ncbi:PEPxxWA-CTERM sorting domain-containing protein [Phenylobacterium sp.]|uniref:PEPxxWA-CTERM sorting domain-containing protein n=1 Tax=Phenylobacterium sp. TaxID=1871053 RepID=UPI0025CF2066|nr:PEPxxWA-CTERM sorting domain-containing protein [Phenylobacterium sp.]MBX3486001.1 PEP-CTERM sorting domain-containing protein [Phenylobacterium sp.]